MYETGSNISISLQYFFSTPAVVEYQSKLPSNRATLMTSEMRQKFREVNEEKELILHEALEAKERYNRTSTLKSLLGQSLPFAVTFLLQLNR